MIKLKTIDSHTAGEPTRMIIEGVPDLGTTDPEVAIEVLREKYDWVRTASILEPRGSDVLVGAVLMPPKDEASNAGVVFFNNAGYLGMCGHGTIGVVTSLAYLGRLTPGPVTIDTPVGRIQAILNADSSVSLENVPSYRTQKDVAVSVRELGTVVGDVAYGGNWFFLVKDYNNSPINTATIDQLTHDSKLIRLALIENNVTGPNGEEVDHIELFADTDTADSRSFVLCPGSAYDRSPCGTGTSAKLACLYADGKIQEGQRWRQESVIGSTFEGKVTIRNGEIIPTISGRAWITGESTLLIDATDPYGRGIH